MTASASEARSGKGHRDENFPVASLLISPVHRGPILAFYRFVRAADDVADHPDLSPTEKLALLDGMEAALDGSGPSDPEAEPLRRELAERGLSARHAIDILNAFRRDVRQTRYADWTDLISYCELSAMPVGRFVLDVHGEERSVWPASDALCAALQVINHLQDCAKDFRALDRVYLPRDQLARHGAAVEELAAPASSPGLLATIRELNDGCDRLLRESRPFSGAIRDTRLALEVAVIQNLAESLVGKLRSRDPLRDRVHAGKGEAIWLAAGGVLRGLAGRLHRRPAPTQVKVLR